MLRVSARRAKPGMVLGRAVYDVRGREVLTRGTKLDEEGVIMLSRSGVADILVEDPRMADVPVGSLYPAADEASAVRAIHVLLALNQGVVDQIESSELTSVQTAVHKMAEALFPVVMGEPELSGMSSQDGYDYVHPAKVAGIGMLVARESGLDKETVVQVGIAAMLMNIGYLALPPGTLDFDDDVSLLEGGADRQNFEQMKKHPELALGMLGDSGLDEGVVRAINEHHERWNGSGYPHGRKGDEISLTGQIVAIADVYHSLVSARPDRPAYKPHEAIEFIVAYSGELFSPALAQVFARRIPQYPAGVGVKLNTGEVAIVVNPNVGHIARPVVRICVKEGKAIREPYDLDLSLADNMRILITEVLL
ncbi:MAG: HD domain-containing protein [Chloroflexi bacterium]|nr:HD domain-containing protein [Chloroflexota bacterium]